MNASIPHADASRKICGARTRTGEPCRRSPMKGGRGGRCKLHGGASLAGRRHPNYKDGKYTKRALAARRARAEARRRFRARLDEVLSAYEDFAETGDFRKFGAVLDCPIDSRKPPNRKQCPKA